MTTLLRLQWIEELMEKVPAGIRTTVLSGADVHAELMLAAVGVENAVLQAVVVQFAQLPLGTPPGIPVCFQSVARFGARMPDPA